jgi:hypothetical protein
VPAESSNHDPNDPDSENHDLLTPLLEIGAILDFRDWAAGQSAGIIQNANGVTIALVPCRSKPTQLFSCPGCFRAAQMDFETGGLMGLFDGPFTKTRSRLPLPICLRSKLVGWLALAIQRLEKLWAMMHRNPTHLWTLTALTKEAGISRSVLAERFQGYLGEPPMSYLTRWRLQLGA